MIDNKPYSNEKLAQMQALPLEAKVNATKRRIMDWYDAFDGEVYVSFSGGKDSTVLADIVLNKCKLNVPLVFCDTGLEYPEIRDFVKTFGGKVEWLKPKMNFKEVIKEKGYPIISKEQAQYLMEYRTTESDRLKDIRWNGNKWGRGKISEKWKPLADAPFRISHKCCNVMKKSPAKSYETKSGKKPIVGTMAYESRNRRTAWLRHGCNSFDGERPISQPMSFWTEQDVLEYLVKYNVPYCSVYGDIVLEDGIYRTTKAKRTGCVFCMFGAHLEKEPSRFELLHGTHPQLYDYCMKPAETGGLGMKEVMDYMNTHCNCHIRY